MFVPWEPQDENVPQQDEYFDVTAFGAPKTKAAPAGYIPVNPHEIVPNEKKLTKKDKEHLTVNTQSFDYLIKSNVTLLQFVLFSNFPKKICLFFKIYDLF